MPLNVGLIGLPNAGKSTTFNVLARDSVALTASYPFSTVEPNRILVDVPDPRLEVLGELTGQVRRVRVQLGLIDIAGLVEGASRGEGLGNLFLDQARHCDMLIHVIGCFAEELAAPHLAVEHALQSHRTVEQELMLSDLVRIQDRASRLEQEVKNDPSLLPDLETAQAVREDLEAGVPVRASRAAGGGHFEVMQRELRCISNLPELILVNAGERFLADAATWKELSGASAAARNSVVAICALLEEEMLGLGPEEAAEYRQSYGIEQPALQSIVAECFSLLGLLRFYTLGDAEVRAWHVPKGCRAVEGAGRIHSDFAKGFIAAEVIEFSDLVSLGSEKEARSRGRMRLEGRDYLIRDGDVIRFRFNL